MRTTIFIDQTPQFVENTNKKLIFRFAVADKGLNLNIVIIQSFEDLCPIFLHIPRECNAHNDNHRSNTTIC
jgi:hypothetical protein